MVFNGFLPQYQLHSSKVNSSVNTGEKPTVILYTDINHHDSNLAASLGGDPGPTPAGKTLPHSYPKPGFGGREHEINQNCLERDLSALLLGTPAVGRRKQ